MLAPKRGEDAPCGHAGKGIDAHLGLPQRTDAPQGVCPSAENETDAIEPIRKGFPLYINSIASVHSPSRQRLRTSACSQRKA